MQTITVDTRTKAGKIIIELATMFSKLDKGVIITPNGLRKPALKTSAFKRDAKPKESKRKPLTHLLNETYNPNFVAMVLKAKKSKNRTQIDPKNVWENI